MALPLNISQNISFDVSGPSNSTTQPAASGTPYIQETELSKIIRYVLLVIIFVFTVVGNVTVCVIPYTNRRMRTFTYFLITNLAVSDVGGIFYLPFIMYQTELTHWPFGDIMCKIVNPSISLFSIVTTNTLVAIALDRFVALVFPFKSRPSHKETALIISLVWLIAFICVLPAFGIRVVQNGVCVEVFPGHTVEEMNHYRRAYGVFLYLVNNCIPVAVIVLIYIKIARRLNHNSVAIPNEKSPTSYNHNHLDGCLEANRTWHERKLSLALCTDADSLRKRHKMEREFTNMLITVVLVFVFCYIPYQTFFFVAEFKPTVYTWKYILVVYPYLYVLMWLPNALNPICYGSMNEQYAKAFRSLLRCTSQSQVYIRGRLNSLSLVPTSAILSLSTRSTTNTPNRERQEQLNSVLDTMVPHNHNTGTDSSLGSH